MTQPVLVGAGPMRRRLLGVILESNPSVPFGDAEFGLTQVQGVRETYWSVSEETYEVLASLSSGMVSSVMDILKQAEKEGRPVVSGVVSANSRRGGAPSPRPRKANLDDLTQRCRNLMVQIANLSDAGAIPAGAVKELSKTYAALQAERDEVFAQFSEIDANLSIGRAIIIEHSMEGA